MNKKEKQLVIALIRFVITGKSPKIEEQKYDWNKIYEIADKNRISAMVYEAVDRLSMPLPTEVAGRLREDYYKAISKEAILQIRYEQLVKDFTQQGIEMIPLKGTLLRQYYPAEWMRERADIDILIEDSDSDRVRERMQAMGYKVVDFRTGNHDVYYLKPAANIEVHRNLFSEIIHYRKFSDRIKKNAVKAEDGSSVKLFSKEDTYLHLLAHMAKHMITSGSGLRPILDIWLFWKRESEHLDQTYLKQSLQELKLLGFHKKMLSLSAWWMEEKKTDQKVIEVGDTIIEDGLFGRVQLYQSSIVAQNMEKLENSLKQISKAKVKAVISLFFPSYSKLCITYPVLQGRPYMLPVIMTRRAFVFCTHQERRVFIKNILRVRKKDVMQRSQSLKVMELLDLIN